MAKRPISWEEERELSEKRWDMVYEKCLNGEINQTEIVTAMRNLNKADYFLLKQEVEKKSDVAEAQEIILQRKAREAEEFYRKRNGDKIKSCN